MDGSGSQALGLRFRSSVRIADCLHAAPGHGYWQLDLGVSQNQGYYFGGPNSKDCSVLGLHWGPPILGNYHFGVCRCSSGPCRVWSMSAAAI